jgi:hypothetical protein
VNQPHLKRHVHVTWNFGQHLLELSLDLGVEQMHPDLTHLTHYDLKFPAVSHTACGNSIKNETAIILTVAKIAFWVVKCFVCF